LSISKLFGYRTLAGSELNWPDAAYELDQLRETFADVAEILPKNIEICRSPT
jgi:hypothetical protein